MLQIIYIVLFFATLFLALRKKNISFIFVYFLSSALYYFNAFEGEIFVGKLSRIGVESYSMNSGTYIVLLINMLLIIFFLSGERLGVDYESKVPHGGEAKVIKLFIAAVLIFSIYMAIRYNLLFRTSYNKAELAEEGGSIQTYFKYLATFSFVLAFVQEGNNIKLPWKIASIVPIIVTFLFGNRSFLVIGVLAIVFDKVYISCSSKGLPLSSYLSKHKKLVISVAAFTFVILVIKGITGALFVGNMDLVKSRLSNPEYYKQVFYVSEPNTISGNLDAIVSHNYQVSRSSYRTLWAYFIPLVTGAINSALGFENFTYAYQRELFGTSNRACTYLGEAFANGGYIVVFFVAGLSLLIMIALFKGYLKCKSNITKTMLLLIGIDMAFYMQRNSMSFQFSRIRDYLYIGIILFLLIGLVTRNHKVHL